MATSLTYSTVALEKYGNVFCKVVDITADSSYTAGGYTPAAADISALARPIANSQTVTLPLSVDAEVNSGGTTIVFDRTNTKIMFFLGSTQCTTTISSKTVRCRVYFAHSNYK